jgi:hypothetical protein
VGFLFVADAAPHHPVDILLVAQTATAIPISDHIRPPGRTEAGGHHLEDDIPTAVADTHLAVAGGSPALWRAAEPHSAAARAAAGLAGGAGSPRSGRLGRRDAPCSRSGP